MPTGSSGAREGGAALDGAHFDHVLLTRFSAAFSAAVPAQEDWLRYRLGFFVDACWSSVRAQRGADFTWLVLFDDRCPDDFRADVEALAEGTFTPVWSHEPWSPAIFGRAVDDLRSRGGAPAPWLLTTRLDSDDGIARDFMAAVQQEFTPTDGLFVDFPRGVQIDRSGGTYLYDQLSSPFLTLVERRRPGTPPRTVYMARHARAREWGPLREVSAPPMWVQVIHGTNLLNMTVGARVSPRVVNERFDLELVYTRDVPAVRLLREKLTHRLRLVRLWWRHPGEVTKWAEAKFWRVRGTHVRPRSSTPNLTEALKARAERLGRRR
ncbi:glycosyltransferase [Terrabacter sp. GCM10028922]|uniref:glycosyltransferase n=1 Tax=Terrabacter sp. GCM10028922 TaxID=3273428 RepID=UPI00360CDDE0